MIVAFFVTIIPTLLFYFLFPKIGIKIKSTFFTDAVSWFLGIYFFALITFFIALLYTSFSAAVLTKAVILGGSVYDIQPAGRKVFVGESAGASLSLNKPMRWRIAKDNFASTTKDTLCLLTKQNKIDYVAFSNHSDYV